MSVVSVRIDRWLTAARIYKSRTLAQRACGAGHVSINGETARSSHPVEVGDEVVALPPRGRVVLGVLGIEEKRQPAPRARVLYDDRSPPPPPREPRIAVRDRGAGRPTKRDARAIRKLLGE